MADAAVEFLLNNLKELLIQHGHLVTETRSDIESLDRDLRVFRAFLKYSVKKRRKDEQTRLLVQSIRDTVYEVEDIIDAFVTQALDIKAAKYFLKAFKGPVDLHGISRKVEEVREKVQQSWNHSAILEIDHDQDKPGEPETRPARKKDVVGFEDVRDELIWRITTETEDLDVISVTGMFGLGKTTLLWKIFDDPKVIYEFPVRIWLTISQEFSIKDIYVTILEKFVTLSPEIRSLNEQELAHLAAGYLESGKFLIVMDDVWNSYDWDALSNALPEHNHMGKVVITTRHMDVGKHASHPMPPFELRCFTNDESWELLQLEALGKLEFHPDLEDVGRLIARDCQGLPLAVVVIGGILGTKYSPTDVNATIKAWYKVSKRVSSHLNEDPRDRMKQFISLSYDKLPYNLRTCFLYMGMFPEDHEIPVSKLIRLWIGEGFIQESSLENSNLEETAEKYLDELINRNLVTVVKMKPNGKVKTCRIHEALRYFCQNEAGNESENFLQEINYTSEGFVPPIDDLHKFRRLSIHSNYINFLSSNPVGHRVRSFACFSKDEYPLPPKNSAAIPAAFKLLRVLDVKPIKFIRIHVDMYQLVHVRYVAFSSDLSVLPSKFNNFHNLQTLIVDTTSPTLVVKADIWKMVQLRHFKTNASAVLPQPSTDSKHGAKLQTLGTISVESCTPELFARARNLKKLGIRGELALLFRDKTGSLSILGKLEKLKLINDSHPSEGHLVLPPPYQFPPGLRSLTLFATYLSWSNMSTLALLENLEVLKIKDKAFMGDKWEWKAFDRGFPCLGFLHIERTDLAVWKASSHHFGKLRGLVLRNCEELVQIPIEFAEIPSLQMLDLYQCGSTAASARKIQEEKSKKGSFAFKLYIFPPLEF